MFYTFQSLTDEFGNDLILRVGRATKDSRTAKRQLDRLNRGEIRDEFNRLLAIKFGDSLKTVQDFMK